MNLHVNFKENRKWAEKSYLGFGGSLGYRLHPETISPHFADLSSTAHVLRLCYAIVHLYELL